MSFSSKDQDDPPLTPEQEELVNKLASLEKYVGSFRYR